MWDSAIPLEIGTADYQVEENDSLGREEVSVLPQTSPCAYLMLHTTIGGIRVTLTSVTGHSEAKKNRTDQVNKDE